MVNVFSFTLFGSDIKYWKGLLKNISIIEKQFPAWEVWVYCGDCIPEDVYLLLSMHSCVKLIPTHQDGMVNKFYRFFAIDDPSVDICIIRDADSRVYARDEACIRDFLASEKLVHIIRDHPNHHHRMMAGMWGIKKQTVTLCLENLTIQQIFNLWKVSQCADTFWSDTEFLCQVLYARFVQHSMIHDETQHFEPLTHRTPFRVPRYEKHFIGQTYEFGVGGEEVSKYEYAKG